VISDTKAMSEVPQSDAEMPKKSKIRIAVAEYRVISWDGFCGLLAPEIEVEEWRTLRRGGMYWRYCSTASPAHSCSTLQMPGLDGLITLQHYSCSQERRISFVTGIAVRPGLVAAGTCLEKRT
jgi:hypothetical protein